MPCDRWMGRTPSLLRPQQETPSLLQCSRRPIGALAASGCCAQGLAGSQAWSPSRPEHTKLSSPHSLTPRRRLHVMLLAQTASISGWGAQASALGQARRPSQALLGEPSRLSCPPSADGMHPGPCGIARTSHRLHPGPAGGRRRRCGAQPSGRPCAPAPVSGMPLQRPWMGTAGPAMLQRAQRAGQRFGFKTCVRWPRARPPLCQHRWPSHSTPPC